MTGWNRVRSHVDTHVFAHRNNKKVCVATSETQTLQLYTKSYY